MKTRIAHLRSRLTYANVAATLALFIALGGTGYAAITLPRNSVGAKQLRKGAVQSGEIRNRTIQTADISKRARNALRGQPGPAGPAGPPGVTERATVTSEGRLTSGTATGSSWQLDKPGTYLLAFGRDVSGCAYSATLAAVPGGTVPEPDAGRVTVASSGGNHVTVSTYSASGTPAQRPFHLIIAC